MEMIHVFIVDNFDLSYIFLLESWNVYKDMQSVFLFIIYKLVVAHVVNPQVFCVFRCFTFV